MRFRQWMTQLTGGIRKLMADRARGWTLLLLLVGFLMLHDIWLDATQINLANIALTKALRTPQELGPVLTARLAQADAGTARLARARGVVLLLAGQPGLAVVAFERAAVLEDQAPDPVTQMWLGEAYWTMGDLEDAIVAWDRAGGVDMLNRKGDELRAAGQLPAAATVFQTMTQRYPAVAAGYAGLGLVALDRLDWSAAERWFSQALARDADLPSVRTGLATVYIQTGRYDQARTHLERAIALRPDNRLAYLLMGDTYARQGDYMAARTWYSQAAERFPTSAEPDTRLALLALDEGRLEDAFAALDEAGRKDPGDHQRQIALSRAYRLAGRPELALAALEQATALAPNNLWTWVWLANAYREAGRCREAQAAYARATALDPANPRVAAYQAQACNKGGGGEAGG